MGRMSLVGDSERAYCPVTLREVRSADNLSTNAIYVLRRHLRTTSISQKLMLSTKLASADIAATSVATFAPKVWLVSEQRYFRKACSFRCWL